MTTAPPDGGFGLWEALIALGMLFLSALVSVAGTTWRLASSRQKVNEKIDAITLEFERRINAEADTMTERFGETIRGMKEQHTEAQFWNRDNFVNKSTFTLIMQKFDERWDRLEDKLDKRDERFDRRLESIEAKLNSGGFGGK